MMGPGHGKIALNWILKNASIYRLIAKVVIQDAVVCSGASITLSRLELEHSAALTDIELISTARRADPLSPRIVPSSHPLVDYA